MQDAHVSRKGQTLFNVTKRHMNRWRRGERYSNYTGRICEESMKNVMRGVRRGMLDRPSRCSQGGTTQPMAGRAKHAMMLAVKNLIGNTLLG